jgi:hypothetical protein
MKRGDGRGRRGATVIWTRERRTQLLRRVGVGAVILLLAIQAIRPARTNPPTDPAKTTAARSALGRGQSAHSRLHHRQTRMTANANEVPSNAEGLAKRRSA